MDVQHLELVSALADRGSITAVAQATQRTPSAVSQQLKSAERRLGVRLVEPAGRGLRLTDAGQLLAECGREVATTLARVQARWDEFRGEPSGTVRLAALPSAATILLPGVYRELAGSSISLECDDVDLVEDAYPALTVDHDLVIGHSLFRELPPGTAGQVTTILAREPLDIAMAGDHPLSAKDSVTPADLADQEWIGVPLGYPFDTVRLAVEEAVGHRLDVTLRLRDNRLIEALLADSARVAVLPRYSTPTGRVVLRELEGIATGRYLYAVARPDRAERLAVRRVLETFRAVAASLRGSR